jgi:hypothetical protein
MSIIKLEKWSALANGTPVRTLQQAFGREASIVSAFEGSYSSLNSSGVNYNNIPPANTSTGIFIDQFEFTPKFADSTLVLETSMLTIYESSNVTDDFRIYAFETSTPRILGFARASSQYDSFGGALNSARFALRTTFSSWGTDTRSINIRMDTSGTNSAVMGFNGRYASSFAPAPFYVTIMEYR